MQSIDDDGRCDADRIGRHAKIGVWVMVGFTAALLALAAAVVYADVHTPEPFAPLEFTNPQIVTSRVDGHPGVPAARLGGTVDVTGTKCNNSRHEVGATTSISWQPVDPRGGAYEISTSSRRIAPGCETGRFQNEIPPQVRGVVRAQHFRGHPAPLWIISGATTPIDPDGREGVTEVWQTEPFAIFAEQ